MPEGKPAGVACIQLDEQLRCRLFGKPERPAVCLSFIPQADVCGDTRQDALFIISALELSTLPDKLGERG